MLNHIIRFSVRNKLIIGLLTLALTGWGIFDLTRLPIDAVPDITNNQVQVITVSPSLAAPEIERLITFPIEQAMASIPGIVENRSFSRFGLSLVTIVFNDNTDVYWARTQVAERLIKVRSEIPADAGNPEMGPVTTGLGEIYQYVVRPKKGYEGKYSPMELRTIQDWIVRRQLLGTKGVADVSSFGGFLKEYEVAVNPVRLKSMNVTMDEVFAALRQNNQNTGGAYIEKGPNVLYIRSEGLVKATDDIGNIVVKHTMAGIPVYIKSLAESRIGHAVRYGAMCFNDEGEVAGAVVMMLKGGNSSQVIRAVKEKIKIIEKTLPEGVVIEPFLDRTKMVDHAIGTVKQNLLEGALIVVFILVLFLGNLRAGLIVASVIPLSMLFAVIMMNAFGVSGNLMSLGALDFGLIVDGAVIIVEAVMHRLYHSRHFAVTNSVSQEQMNAEVEQASGKMMNSAVFGQVIILIVYLPILALVGIEGKMFKPMAQTVSFALIGAFILSLTYVPMISSLFLSKKLKHADTWSDKMMKFLEKLYLPAIDRTLEYPKTIVFAAITAFIAVIFIVTRMGGEFIPKLEEGDFAVDTRLLTGSSLSTTINATQKTAGLLLKRFPEVEKVVTKIGSGEIPTDPMPVEAADMMVILKDKREWTSAGTFDELANKMSKALDEVPGVSAGFQFPVQMRFNELMTGARQDVVCKIFGEDLDSLATYAKHLGEIINSVKGAKDLYIETVTGLPQIVINYNRDAIARYKLTVAGVNRIVRSAFAGETAGMVYENERRFDLVIRLEEQQRKNLSDVQELLIATPAGLQIPLSNVAAIDIKEGPNQIQREDAKRRIVVGFNVRGRDVQTIVEELRGKADQQLKCSPGYYITYGGQFENLVQAKQRLSIALPVALLLIFVMLYFAFGKLKYGILIFSAIPLSAVGGVLALWLRGMPFSISAGVGFIALFGVAVLNGIVLIAEFNRLKAEGVYEIKYVVMEGTKIRLRPVLMTASVASLGFLPMALSHGAGAEVQRPLATVVIGGLITATFLTLMVLPILYAWVEKPKDKKRKHSIVMPLVLLVVLLTGVDAGAQAPAGKPVNLAGMLKQADEQNLSLQAATRGTDYWKQLQAAVFETPRTLIGGEYGNINSVNNDTRFFISQSFGLPLVYKRQKEFYRAGQLANEALTGMRKAELEREVKLAFYHQVDLLERRKLLLLLDSVYSRLLASDDLRFKTGESSMLEKTSAELQWRQIVLQQEAVVADISIGQQRLQYLLNSRELLLPLYDSPLKDGMPAADSALINAHPALQYQEGQLKVEQAQTAVEKAKLIPELTLGYNNQSLVGYQTRDGITQQYYSAGNRFGIYQFSLGLPLFNGAGRSRIKAGRVNEAIAGINAMAVKQQLNNRLLQLTGQFNKQRGQLRYFEASGLQQSGLLMKNARLGFEKGDINYLEWIQLMNNAVSIQLGYLESVRLMNETSIELEYLTGK
jgi:cobalt-zinc-cadmium resistance protein CzcA